MIIFKAKLVTVKKQLTRIKLSFATKDPIDELVLAQLTGVNGWVAFSEDEFKKKVEEVMADRKVGITEEGKSHSQILRGTLYRIWYKSDEKISWDEYYNKEMTRIDTHYKTKYL